MSIVECNKNIALIYFYISELSMLVKKTPFNLDDYLKISDKMDDLAIESCDIINTIKDINEQSLLTKQLYVVMEIYINLQQIIMKCFYISTKP